MKISLKDYKEYVAEGGELSFEAWANRVKELRREQRRKTQAAWRAKNKDKVAQYARNYRAKRGGCYAGDVFPEAVEEVDKDLKEKYGDKALKAMLLREWGHNDKEIETMMERDH